MAAVVSRGPNHPELVQIMLTNDENARAGYDASSNCGGGGGGGAAW